MLWHSWTGAKEETLNALLDQFMTIYPGVTIIHQSVPANELSQEYLDEAMMGAEPDLLIAPAN